MKKFIHKLLYTLIFVLTPVCSALAFDDFDDDVDDLLPMAPIDDYVFVLLIAAIAITFWFFKKQQKAHNVSNS